MEKLYGIDTLKGRVPQSHALRDNLTEPQRSGFYEEKRGPGKALYWLSGRKATDEQERFFL